VNLVLTHLDLENAKMYPNDTECLLQYLDIVEGIDMNGALIGRYCDKKIPPHIVSNGMALTLNLVTVGGRVVPNQFVATYSIDDSGLDIKNLS
jgi:hypothetical protein